MKNLFLIAAILFSLNTQAQNNAKPVLEIVNYDQLKEIIEVEDDVLYVINFWATWCKPCIDELPGFMEVNEIYKDDPKFKMILVSLDQAKAIDSRVKKFIEKNNINVDVYILDDNKRMNEWIPAFDENWSGAIPATVFYKNKKKILFRELEITKYELEDMVDDNL